MDATNTPPKCSDTKSMADLKVVTPGTENLVEEPHNHDVLCGRGGSINSHPGNERFRELVEKRKRVYLTARFKREKRLIASSIVSEIRGLEPSGRFLSKDAKSGKWKDIGDEKARDKTSQALRENAPKVRAEIETEINKQRAEMKHNEVMEDATIAETTAIPPSPYYHAWAGGHYRPIYGYALPPGAPPPEYPPPGPYQPYDGGPYGYSSPPPQEQQLTPSPHGSNHSHHSHQSMQTDEPNHQHSHPSPQNQTQYSHHNRNAEQQPKPEGVRTFDTIPSFVSSVPSSIAAWTKNSFSFGQSMDAGDHHQPVVKPESKPIAYVHRPESDRRVTFRDDYHGAHERSRHYNRPRRPGSSQFRNGYSSHRPRGGPRSTAVRNHPSQQRPAKRPYVQETPTDDDENNSLLSQVASHIMGSWETPIPCANGSHDDLAITNEPYQDEGQEVELVEMMSFEDPIIEEEDDIREDESQSMQPPQDRRVEIDWPSRIGSCGTWLPEASSFFSVQDNPLSPAASMEMDQSAAFSCGGSIGGASLCQVFANDQQMISGGPAQHDTRYLSQNPSWGHPSGNSIGQLPSWEASTNVTPQMDHKTLNQIPSWERSFRSKSPCNSTICSDMSRDECDIKSMGSGDLGRGISPVPLGVGTSPRNSISQNVDLFEGRMRE
mmetsp:Transcript_30207/g.54661  ORF Transcript_30207/g.54661 Transcript_30207/m.54661 type:complete len:662 (-) Transcript_30207:107-2092(-)